MVNLRLAGAAENSRDIDGCTLALGNPSRYSLSVMQIPALSHPKLILSVQVRSLAKTPVQAERVVGDPSNDDLWQTCREAAVFQVALRETGRLADRLDAISLL